MDKFHCLFLRISLGQSRLILGIGIQVIVLFNGIPIHIPHAQLLALIDKRGPSERHQDRSHGLSCENRIRIFREIMIYGTGLIMIFEEYRIPSVVFCGLLTVGQRLLQIRKRPVFCLAPDLSSRKLQIHVAEFKDHVKHAVFTDPFRQLIRRNSISLAYGEDIFPLGHLLLEFMQVIQDPVRIRGHIVDTHPAVLIVRRTIGEICRLLDVGNSIHAETADTLVQPEIGHIIERLSHLWIFPVQVRLRRRKGMQIILLPGFAPGPGRPAEDTPPVIRLTAIRLPITPDIPVAVVILLPLCGLLKPLTLIRSMIEDQIHDNADPLFTRFTDQTIHVLHTSITRIDLIIIRHIITIVHHRRFINRRKPYSTHAQLLQMIKPLTDPVQIAITIPIRILKTIDINLISIDLLPPCHFLPIRI